MAYLHPGLCEVNSVGQLFSCEHVRIVSLLKHLLQLTELVASECCTIAPFLFVLPICQHRGREEGREGGREGGEGREGGREGGRKGGREGARIYE